jgi:BASS family bile acid:Na+ symporter
VDLKALIPTILQASLFLIVAAVGMKGKWSDLRCAFEQPGLLLRSIIAVNVVVPLVAVLAIKALPIPPVIGLGIMVMAVSPIAPFAPGKMMQVGAKGTFAIGMFVALTTLAIIFVPATVELVSKFFIKDISVPIRNVAGIVVPAILVPMAVGLLIANLVPGIAPTLSKYASVVAFALLVPIILILLYKTGLAMLGLFGNGTLWAMVLIIGSGLAAGHLLGGPDPHNRMALAAAASARHPAIAVMIAKQDTDDKQVVLTVLLFLLVSLILSTLYQRWAMRSLPGAADEPASLGRTR